MIKITLLIIFINTQLITSATNTRKLYLYSSIFYYKIIALMILTKFPTHTYTSQNIKQPYITLDYLTIIIILTNSNIYIKSTAKQHVLKNVFMK